MDGEKKKLKFSIGYLIIAFWAILLLQQVFSAYLQPTRTSYSDFKAAVGAGRVSDVAIGHAVIRGHMKTDATAEAEGKGPEAQQGQAPQETAQGKATQEQQKEQQKEPQSPQQLQK
jgi:hypothetical protein